MIYSSILKHGYSNFSLEILEYCNQDQAISREQYYLDLLKPEYNILKKAGSRLGSKHSSEVIAKMRAKAVTPERLAALNARLHANPEFQAKNLEQLNRLNSSPEHKEHLERLHQNPEIQAKRLTVLKVYNLSPEHQEHLKRLNSSGEHTEHLKRLNLLQSQKVEVLDTWNNEKTVYPSISEAARAIGVDLSTISKAFKSKPGESSVFVKKKRYQVTKFST